VRQLGRQVLDEIKVHEGAVALADIFGPAPEVLERGAYRVVHGDGLLYETSLLGSSGRDVMRLIEFDRPQGHVVRVYGVPDADRRRFRALEDGDGGSAVVLLERIFATYADYTVKEALDGTGHHSLRKMEESVPIPRFLDALAMCRPREVGEMTRYGVTISVRGAESGGEVKTCAALAETAFDNAVEVLLGGGWVVVESRDYLLEAHPLAADVRKAVAGIGACTWWNDADCLEFAKLLEAGGKEDVLGGVGLRSVVEEVRRGERRDEVAKFVEQKSYPDEPTL